MVGNTPNFAKIDILRCFLRLNKDVGRQELAKELGLGEGTIRTILKILKSKKLIQSTKRGHFLSKNGNEMLSQIQKCLGVPQNAVLENIYPDKKKIGVIVKNASRLRKMHELRDIAVKNGADGALILKFNGNLYAPESDYEYDYSELERYFKLKNNDILVIAFSSDFGNAEKAALSIAVELNDMLKNL